MEETSFDLGNSCAALPAEDLEELRRIVAIYAEAGNAVTRIVSYAGGKLEVVYSTVPEGLRALPSQVAEYALREAFRLAEWTQPDAVVTAQPDKYGSKASGETGHTVASAVTGALGGIGGFWTIAPELVATTTIMLRSIQQIAMSYGEDLSDPYIRGRCIGVFASGGPTKSDDGGETGLMALRIWLSGDTGVEFISKIAARFGVKIAPTLPPRFVPLFGAAVGAILNPSFMSHFNDMAHVSFRMLKLERTNNREQLLSCFQRLIEERESREAAGRNSGATR